MLAVTKTRPEPGIEILERPEPRIQKDDDVLLEVAACGVCGTDLHFYEWAGDFTDEITLPRILGHEVAGTVVEVGRAVTTFRMGDRVVTETWGGCGRCYYCRLGRFNHCLHQVRIGQKADGGMARYIVIPEVSLYKTPEDIASDEAAVVEVVGVALRCLERVDLKPGDDVAVIGPGPVGLCAALLADRAGAHRVIVLGLAEDEMRLAMARRLGCDVVTGNRQDAVAAVRELTDGRGVDLTIDASGGPGTISLAVELAKPGGQVGLIGLSPEAPFSPTRAIMKELTIHTSFRRLPSTWQRAINLVATRKVDVRPLITHRLPVARAEEAFELLLRREGIKAIITPD